MGEPGKRTLAGAGLAGQVDRDPGRMEGGNVSNGTHHIRGSGDKLPPNGGDTCTGRPLGLKTVPRAHVL